MPVLVVIMHTGACSTDPDGPPPELERDASDSTADANLEIDPDCDAERIRFVIGDRPLAVGDYCDNIDVCVAGPGGPDAVRAVEPDFDCQAGQGACEPGAVSCTWRRVDVGVAEYNRLCAITGLDVGEIGDAPLRCWLYL